jgi:hypothetical protein
MNDYYRLGRENKKEFASAASRSPVAGSREIDLTAALETASELPFELQLVKLTVSKDGTTVSDDLKGLTNPWLDYLPNSLELPLMSNRLKEFITENLTGDEGLGWIRAKVNGPGGARNYYVPKFESAPDVLDKENTVYSKEGGIVTPHFSLNKIHQLGIFHCPGPGSSSKITSALYVNEMVKRAIQKNRLTGMTFEKVNVTEQKFLL